MRFTEVQAQAIGHHCGVKVRTLDAFYREHIIVCKYIVTLIVFLIVQNCYDSVKVARKGGKLEIHSCTKLPYQGLFCHKGVTTNQLKWPLHLAI